MEKPAHLWFPPLLLDWPERQAWRIYSCMGKSVCKPSPLPRGKSMRVPFDRASNFRTRPTGTARSPITRPPLPPLFPRPTSLSLPLRPFFFLIIFPPLPQPPQPPPPPHGNATTLLVIKLITRNMVFMKIHIQPELPLDEKLE